MRHSKQLRNLREKGQSMVEFGLIYSLFLFILIATIDLGVVLFMHEALAERVRGAARFGITRPLTPSRITEIQNVVLFGRTAGEGDAGWMGLTRSNVIVQLAPGATGAAPRLLVRISGYKYRYFTPMISGLRYGKPIDLTLPMETP
jgi:Flp pilus assembly protein TadG